VADTGAIADVLKEDSAYLPEKTAVDSPDTQSLQCCSILWGHDTEVMAIFLSTPMDLLVSGSLDGTIVLHQVSVVVVMVMVVVVVVVVVSTFAQAISHIITPTPLLLHHQTR